MSLIGVITVYNCDDQGCDIHKVVTDEKEGDFCKEWFAGLDKHFCGGCRGKVQNAAAIADQERRLREIEQSVRQGISSGRRRAVNVH